MLEKVRSAFAQDFSLYALRATIIAWAVMLIALAVIIDNKWTLAGILAYEVLP